MVKREYGGDPCGKSPDEIARVHGEGSARTACPRRVLQERIRPLFGGKYGAQAPSARSDPGHAVFLESGRGDGKAET